MTAIMPKHHPRAKGKKSPFARAQKRLLEDAGKNSSMLAR